MDVMIPLIECAELCEQSYYAPKIHEHSFLVSADGLYIAVAGTNNFENLLEDVEIIPRKSPRGYWVHGGCVHGYDLLLPHVQTYIKPGVTIIGHSLGGGIAQLLSEKFSLPAITFGSLALYCESETPKLDHTRIVNDGDPIPNVPLWPYRHACAPFVLDGSLSLPMDNHYMSEYIKRLAS